MDPTLGVNTFQVRAFRASAAQYAAELKSSLAPLAATSPAWFDTCSTNGFGTSCRADAGPGRIVFEVVAKNGRGETAAPQRVSATVTSSRDAFPDAFVDSAQNIVCRASSGLGGKYFLPISDTASFRRDTRISYEVTSENASPVVGTYAPYTRDGGVLLDIPGSTVTGVKITLNGEVVSSSQSAASFSSAPLCP